MNKLVIGFFYVIKHDVYFLIEQEQRDSNSLNGFGDRYSTLELCSFIGKRRPEVTLPVVRIDSDYFTIFRI